ncbi:hypothetical protein [Flavobacterium sp.]
MKQNYTLISILEFLKSSRPITTKSNYLVLFIITLFGFLKVNAQTTLISPTINNGGFESGLTGWTTAQAIPTDGVWYAGTATKYAGTNSAYISNNNGTANAYSGTNNKWQHLYKAIAFPAGETDINLSFYWKALGEGPSNDWDNLKVYVSNIVPTAGSPNAAVGQVGATWYNNQGTTWQNATITLPASLAGTTRYLIFQWKQDPSGAYNPPAAIDNITLTSKILGAPANDLCANATNLPCGTTNLAGTTVGTTNVANVSGCTMSNYGVWYTFLGNGQQTTISTNPSFDIKLSVSTGTCGAQTNIACTDSAPETATFTTINGTRYYVYVAYYGSTGTAANTGNFTISRSCTAAPVVPPNDLCANATTLACGTTNLAGTTVGTTNVANVSGCTMSNYGVWYTFLGNGQQTTISTNPSFDIKLSVSTGTCGAQTNIACTDSAPETATFTTINGTRYYVYVAYYGSTGTAANTGTFTISRSCTVAPPTPCSSITNIAACGTLINKTIASGSGMYGSSACGWTTPGIEAIYSFTPATTGNYIINQANSYAFIDYQFRVASSGCGETGWTCIDDLSGASVSPGFTLTAGIQYYILLDPESTAGGNVKFTITCPPPPPANDDCLNAIALPVNTLCSFSTYTNAGATASTGITAPGCSLYSGGDVWFSAVVPANGILQIDTVEGVLTDGGMAIYSGTCGTLTLIECDDDDSANGLMPYIQKTGLTPGTTIYIRVWEYGNDNNGTFGICVTTPLPPVNDNPCSSIELNVNTTCAYQTFTTIAATNTPGVSVPGCGNYLGGDVWFNFIVPPNGNVKIDSNTGVILDGGMAVYSGTCGALTLVQCDNDSSVNGAMPYLSFTGLTPGSTLFIRFWEFGNDNNGTFNICISTPCTPGTGIGNSDAGCPKVVTGELGFNGADPAPINGCGSTGCVDLEANYLALGQTTNYSVESITYNPPPYQFGCLANPVSVNIDDVWSPVINLPFTFCFYGNTFNSCVMGSNGVLSFNVSGANGPSGYSFSQNLPSTTGALFANTIYGVYHDIDPSKGGQVGWELITLSSGCRALVASWENVPMFRTNSILYTGMMVLYENTNIIEVYIKEKNVEYDGYDNWNGGNAVIGLQNATGTQAVVAPGRNSLDTNWTTSQEAWRFTPSGTTLTSVKWYEGAGTTGTVLGTSNTLTVCPTSTKTYTAEITYTTCTGAIIKISDQTTVNVISSKTWNGSIDTDWNKPNNWTPTGIPSGSDCVLIPVTGKNPIISGTGYNGLAGTLTINSNATLTVNSNNNITVTDGITVQLNGNFIVSNNANLVQINNAANFGNITYKRDANIRTLDYVYWSSPVANQNINSLFSPIVSGPKYEWNTTISNGNGGQGNWVSLASTTMTAGKGYIIRGPSSAPFNNATSNALTSSFIGIPNNGTFTVPIYRGNDTNSAYHTGTNGVEVTNFSDNWNLLGNPYPSSIRGSQFLYDNRTKIEGNIRLWTHGTLPSALISNPFYESFGYNYTAGDYLNYNFTGTSCCPNAGIDLFIGAGQSFMVQMKDGAAGTNVVTFNNSLRNASYPNNTFYKVQNAIQLNDNLNINDLERNRIWLDIINSNNVSDRTLVGYIQGASMGRDSFYDCLTQNTGAMLIYSMIDQDKFSIQGRALPFDDNDHVSVGINVPSNGEYSIGIAGIDGLFANQSIYLKDNLLNTINDLKAGPYHFTISTGIQNSRFEIVYRNSTLDNGDFSQNQDLKVIVKEHVLVESSDLIKEIMVYNIVGQIIDRYENIASNKITLSSLIKTNTTLLLKIKLDNGQVFSKKIIY